MLLCCCRWGVEFPAGRRRENNNIGSHNQKYVCPLYYSYAELFARGVLYNSSVFAEQSQQQWPQLARCAHPIIVRHNHVGEVSCGALFNDRSFCTQTKTHLLLAYFTREENTRGSHSSPMTTWRPAWNARTPDGTIEKKRFWTRRGGPPRSRAWEWILPKETMPRQPSYPTTPTNCTLYCCWLEMMTTTPITLKLDPRAAQSLTKQ
jgi:hypothetical protein